MFKFSKSKAMLMTAITAALMMASRFMRHQSTIILLLRTRSKLTV